MISSSEDGSRKGKTDVPDVPMYKPSQVEPARGCSGSAGANGQGTEPQGEAEDVAGA